MKYKSSLLIILIGMAVAATPILPFKGNNIYKDVRAHEEMATDYNVPHQEGPMFYPASYSYDISGEPSYFSQKQYTFDSMNFNNAHRYYRGESVKVAVIDSGLNYTHEDFADTSGNQIIQGHSRTIDYSSGSWLYYQFDSGYQSKIVDTLGHGTNVASVIASQINALGCAGIAPNVELYVYKVTNTNNGYEWYAINSALQYCISEKIDIINMSFQAYENAVTYNGSTMGASAGCSSVMTNYINSCYNAGITLVAAAGNYNTSEPSYPASNNHVISVGSLAESSTTEKAGYSNLSNIDLVAPGTVYVADKGTNSSYKKTSGTSFSAPIVTAAIALYKQLNPSATPSQIETALKNSCDQIAGSPAWAGSGRLNIEKFLGIEYPSIEVTYPLSGEVEINVEDEYQLEWIVNDQGLISQNVEFEIVQDEDVISISNSGLITALKEGEAYVMIKSVDDENIYAEVAITVSNAPVTLTSISIDGNPTTSFEVGDNFTFDGIVTAHYSNGSTENITSSASFTGYNMLNEGNQTVTVSYGGITATYQITITSSGGSGGSEDINDYTVGTTALSNNDITNGMKVVWGTSNTNLAYTIESNWVKLSSTYANWLVFTVEGNSEGFKLKHGDEYVYSSADKKVEFNSINYSTFTLSSDNNNCVKSVQGYYVFNSTGLRPYTSIDSRGKSYLYPLTLKKIASSIGVSINPAKTSYMVGETFDPTGLVISRSFSDSTSDTYSYVGHENDFSFNPSLSTPLTIQDTTIEVTHSNKTCNVSIVVKSLSSISISGYKTSFVEGDAFSFGGTVTAHYSDSTTADVTNEATFTGYDMTNVSNQTVTVSYGGQSLTYDINVSAGTLSSISLSGQTTVYQKNAPFSFDGICTVTFNNGYQKSVTPTSISSPNMSTGGVKEVTVSYTYNNKTLSTSYNITVNALRTVIETTTSTEYSLVGTVTWPSNTQTINPSNSVTLSTDGYTTAENNSIRLGSGSNTGTVTIKTSTAKITKIVVSAKSYGSDSSVHLTIDGTDNTITSSYTNYVKEFSKPTDSVAIATTASKKRAYIQTITVYETKETTIETDISTSEDCIGLETFISTYMHMDYTENLGYCSDNEHHYYSTAKAAFNALNNHQRNLFTSNSAYLVEWTRLSTWASKNGDSLNQNKKLEVGIINPVLSIISDNSFDLIITLITISIASISICGYFILHKKRKIR